MDGKLQVVTLRGSCYDGRACPAVRKIVGDDGVTYFVGPEVTDPARRAALGIGAGEVALGLADDLVPELQPKC